MPPSFTNNNLMNLLVVVAELSSYKRQSPAFMGHLFDLENLKLS